MKAKVLQLEEIKEALICELDDSKRDLKLLEESMSQKEKDYLETIQKLENIIKNASKNGGNNNLELKAKVLQLEEDKDDLITELEEASKDIVLVQDLSEQIKILKEENNSLKKKLEEMLDSTLFKETFIKSKKEDKNNEVENEGEKDKEKIKVLEERLKELLESNNPNQTINISETYLSMVDECSVLNSENFDLKQRLRILTARLKH